MTHGNMNVKKTFIINGDHVSNNFTKNNSNFNNGGGNAVRMTSVTILGMRTAREDEDTLTFWHRNLTFKF
jgi:hypothetical protein